MAFALFVLQIGCAESSASEPSPTPAAPSTPTIEFVYPHSNDLITDYPIFIETKVTNCKLEAPVQYWSGVEQADASKGHIHYTLDNSPIFATMDTKVVIDKPIGKSLPVGKHILRAELVYINHEKRNPPVFSEIPIMCERAQQKADSQSPNAPLMVDDRTRRELQEVEKQLTEVQQQLTQLKSQVREVPNP
jgi:hypothetical protein